MNKAGLVFLDKKPVGNNELALLLASLQTTNEAARVFISGDVDARHGDIIHVLDLVRAAGIQNVAFEIRPGDQAKP